MSNQDKYNFMLVGAALGLWAFAETIVNLL